MLDFDIERHFAKSFQRAAEEIIANEDYWSFELNYGVEATPVIFLLRFSPEKRHTLAEIGRYL